MHEDNMGVGVSKNYSMFYWINATLWALIIAIPSGGIGLLLFPVLLWYKKAVINRTKIIFDNAQKRFIFQRGRWFVKDDDVVPVKSVDNVKLNRSISGKIFGWCNIEVETRAEKYKIKYVSTKAAERFRESFLETV